MPLDADIPVKEVERYMGFRGTTDIDDDTRARITKAIDLITTQSHPRIISKEYPVTISGYNVTIHAGSEEVVITSESLAKNLEGCCGAVLLAATVGSACDMLVRRASVTSITEASIYQAAGAAAIEAFLDRYNDKLETQYEAEGISLRPRFSPGYGDLSLEHQKDWFRLLDITKQIGVELTDSLLMTPSKSVTAIIGLSYVNGIKTNSGCEQCTKKSTCEFSKGRA